MKEEKYSKVYTSFAGCDVVVFLDGKVIGELSEVKWKKNLDGMLLSPAVTGTIVATVFDRDPLEGYERKEFNILTRFANECGERKLEYINGARLQTKEGGIAVDDVTQEFTYKFKANDVREVPWPDTYKEMFQYLLENMDSPVKENRIFSLAYRDMLTHGLDHYCYDVVNGGKIASYKLAEKQLKEQEATTADIVKEFIKQIGLEKQIYS